MEDFVKAFDALADSIGAKVSAMVERRLEAIIKEKAPADQRRPTRKEVTGNNELAAELGRSAATIGRWKKAGVLDDAIVSEYGRTVIYDVEKAKNCLRIQPVSAGRPKNR